MGVRDFMTALFRKQQVVDKPITSNFDVTNNRLARYALYWAFFESTQYESIQSFTTSLLDSEGLYEHIRPIYNPVSRLANFYIQHICGGVLDNDAGNGKIKPSSLPIVGASATTQKAIATFWRTSQFATKKDLLPMYGAALGDAFISLEPNLANNGLACEVIHPSQVNLYETNSDGECVSYDITRIIYDYEKGRDRSYRETALLTDQGVEYVTTLDNVASDIYGYGERWVADLPFIPIQHIKHMDRNRPFGWAEMHQKRRAIQELDDAASKLNDYIRKAVDPIWLFAGLRRPKKPHKNTTTTTTTDTRAASSYLAVYTNNADAKAHALLANLDLEYVLQNIQAQIDDLESTYPELRVAKGSTDAAGDVSGRALLVARQDAEDKVITRRLNYDTGIVNLHKKAMFLGHRFGYEGYDQRVNYLDSSTLEHEIGHRPVFTPHASERSELTKSFWVNAHLARRAGVPLGIFLRNEGWEQDAIDEIIDSPEYRQTFEQKTTSNTDDDSTPKLDKNQADPNLPVTDFN